LHWQDDTAVPLNIAAVCTLLCVVRERTFRSCSTSVPFSNDWVTNKVTSGGKRKDSVNVGTKLPGENDRSKAVNTWSHKYYYIRPQIP
jgi:hypothetical protein